MPSQFMQIGIVFLGLSLLPLAIRLLWKLRLLPLAVYAFLAKLVFVRWAETHPALSLGIFVGLAALAAVSWLLVLRRHIAEEREAANYLLATATHYYPQAPVTVPETSFADVGEDDYWFDR